MENFVEMRDSVADPKFLLRKKIEAKLYERYPKEWIPLYSMVTFTDMSYAEAYAQGKIQDKVMNKVMADPRITENWDKLDLEEILQKMQTARAV
jgi:kynurenine 3-monooxygenase